MLRFNLKRRKCYSKAPYIVDFYLIKPILPDNIDILKRIDEDGNTFTLEDITYEKRLIWKQLKY